MRPSSSYGLEALEPIACPAAARSSIGFAMHHFSAITFSPCYRTFVFQSKKVSLMSTDIKTMYSQCLGVSLITGGDTGSAPREDPDSTLEELAEYFQDSEEDELDSVMRSIGHEINCLLRLSVAIRNPAPHDQFKSRVGVEVVEVVEHFKYWDMQHIKAKFPDVESDILERLARATSSRRQYFKYREQHTALLADGLDEDVAVVDPIERATTLASSLPNHVKDLGGISEPPPIDYTISEASGTSYATSVSALDHLRVPPIPREHENGPIKCPFCHMFVLIDNRSDWK